MRFQGRTAGLIASALALALAGCSRRPVTTTAPPPTKENSATVALTAQPTGTLAINWNPTNKSMLVRIIASGFAPRSIHPVHIHTGSCKAAGPIVYPLPNLIATATGSGSLTASIPNVPGIKRSGWYLNIHTGPGLSPAAQFRSIACVDIATTTTSPYSFSAALTGDPATRGSAAMTLSAGHVLTITGEIVGLPPHSTHAEHLHRGSCDVQGPVAYALPVLVANANGIALIKATIPKVSSLAGLYLNVHNGTDLSTQVGFTPVVCGNLLAVRM